MPSPNRDTLGPFARPDLGKERALFPDDPAGTLPRGTSEMDHSGACLR